MEKCLEAVGASGEGMDPKVAAAKRQKQLDEYEKSLEHTYVVPPHGIEPVNVECAYPIKIGNVGSIECKEVGEGKQ